MAETEGGGGVSKPPTSEEDSVTVAGTGTTVGQTETEMSETPASEEKGSDTKREDHEAINMSSHEFLVPTKQIGPDDIPKWEKSQAYHDLMGFILAMNDAVKGQKISSEYPVSQALTKLTAMLNIMDGWVDEFPPIEQPQRFGNKAYRQWFTKFKENAESLVREVMEERYHPAAPEVTAYLLDSTGNETRIDYGTGHELSFVAFLCCLYKLGVLTEADAPGLVLKVFERYLTLVRRLQLEYRMEPAGSHGVWSLDDHQFLPFLWGSSQLIDHPRIHPKSFVKPDICDYYSKDFMFLGAIKFIYKVKTGPFAEHSNQLWNISSVQHWTKVNSGLIKMYKAEVLAKFPVVQHFYFGSLLTLAPAT